MSGIDPPIETEGELVVVRGRGVGGTACIWTRGALGGYGNVLLPH